MARGGKRPGAGRKALGITRKVSLTLTAKEWEQIEASGKTVAAFLRQLMQQPMQGASVDTVHYWKEEAENHRKQVMEAFEEIGRLRIKLEKSNSSQNVERLTRREVEHLWMICSEDYSDKPAVVLAEAKDALFRNLFRAGEDLTEIKTHPQYVCPFTNKRFGSPDKLIRAAIPRLIQSTEHHFRSKKSITDTKN